MRIVLGLIVIALFAYLGSNLYRLERLPPSLRALISSGLGFFGIGLALGPYAIGMLDEPHVAQLDVIINLGVGWVGLLFGLQFNRVDLRRLPWRRYLGAGTEAIIAGLFVAASLMILANWIPARFSMLSVAGVLAAAASCSSPTTAAEALYSFSPRGLLIDTARLFASVDAIPAIITLGAVLSFAGLQPAHYGPVLDGLFWLGVAVLLAVVLGALFHLLTLYRYTDNQMLVITLGLVVFTGGAAHFLMISPLFVNFLVGVVVANRSPQRSRVLRALLSLEKPIYLIFLTLAGAVWRPLHSGLWLLVLVFVASRFFGKLAGGSLACKVAGLRTRTGWGLGPALLPHGGMALVIALNFRQFFPGTEGDLVLSAVLVSMLLATLVAPWSLKRLLTAEGEMP